MSHKERIAIHAVRPRIALPTIFLILGAIVASIPTKSLANQLYAVEIVNLGLRNSVATFVCEDDKRSCSAMVPIDVNGQLRNVEVIALFEPGNAYFSFRLDGSYLRVGALDFLQMSIGSFGSQESMAPLYAPLPAALSDDNGSGVRSPVLRFPSDLLANLRITVYAERLKP